MSFSIFVVTCRVTNLLPKLVGHAIFMRKKMNFHFWKSLFSAISFAGSLLSAGHCSAARCFGQSLFQQNLFKGCQFSEIHFTTMDVTKCFGQTWIPAEFWAVRTKMYSPRRKSVEICSLWFAFWASQTSIWAASILQDQKRILKQCHVKIPSTNSQLLFGINRLDVYDVSKLEFVYLFPCRCLWCMWRGGMTL